MRIADRLQQNLTIALDTLRAGKIRSALTILGVVIGVATVMAMAAIVAGILIASWIIGQGDGNGNADVDAFPASRAWLLVAIVGVGYMVSRGLAKAGSRGAVLG